ncbi:O-antigen ligase family protein [Winogradskyella sp.]|nr:O-antigen ligase family protein [Winogradskyella sp.]MDA8874186.1 O-antigen ligase family protein [Winogradskyella sp.]
MKQIYQLNVICLILAVFFLPIHLNYNNIALVCFIGLSIILFAVEDRKEKWERIKNNKWVLLIVVIPFLLNALGLIYTDEPKKGLDYTLRTIPFLCIPLIAIVLPIVFITNYKKMGYALVLGCLFVALYSWSHALIEISTLNKSWEELFGPLYSHHNLVRFLDLHAAYLSICIYTAIGFLVVEFKNFRKSLKTASIISIILLLFFMFHLLSRNAIIYFLIASIVFLILSKQWKLLISGSVLVIILAVSAYNIKHNYLRDRIFNNLNFFEKKTQFSKKDDRFDRLAASYEVFTQRPIIGYGTAAESKHRIEIFKRDRDMVAYNESYNAHNQFFEYLSTYGTIGGLSYIIFFMFLFYKAFKLKNGFLVFTITGLFLACFTESVFERSQGVVYTALIIGLMLSFHLAKKETKTTTQSATKT